MDAETAEAARQIQAVIELGLEATRTQNIDLYMRTVPDGAVVAAAGGGRITREQLREAILQQWRVITATLAVHMAIESLAVDGDRAEDYTFQRYYRRILSRDEARDHDVLTTRRHRELWQRLTEGWRCLHGTELDGEVLVDGQSYDPEG